MFNSWLIGYYVEILGVIEILGFITSLVYLYFAVRQIIWLWPFGILSSALFIIIFFGSKFYADMGLQVYYLGVSIYGWIYWSRGNTSESRGQRPVSRVSGRMSLTLLAAAMVLLFGIVYLLKTYTDSDVPWGDGFTTAFSIVATWMLARKILEHWLVWILVDTVAAGLYIYKGLYPTAVLYIIYSIIAVVGFYRWRHSIQASGYV